MNCPRVDLTGYQFQHLTVIGLSGRSHCKEGKIWICRCKCGNTVERTSVKLKGGSSKHCGCIRNYNVDLTGLEFNSLRVLERLDKPNPSVRLYSCECVCGTRLEITNRDLTNGRVRSCGCQTKGLRWKGHGLISGTFWARVRSCAKQRDIALELSMEDAWEVFLNQGGKCALSGIDLVFGDTTKKHRDGMNTASLDRIDSSLGYIKGNIQWVHKTVNRMKWDIDQDDFLEFCRKIVSYYGNAKDNQRKPIRKRKANPRP